MSSPTLQEQPSEGARQRRRLAAANERDISTQNMCSKGENSDLMKDEPGAQLFTYMTIIKKWMASR
jgi:hypothetical protein